MAQNKTNDGPLVVMTATNPPGTQLPDWQRTSIVDEEDGTVYLPIGGLLGGDVLSAIYDGIDVIREGGHPFAPSTWFEKVSPERAAHIRQVRSLIIARYHDAVAKGLA